MCSSGVGRTWYACHNLQPAPIASCAVVEPAELIMRSLLSLRAFVVIANYAPTATLLLLTPPLAPASTNPTLIAQPLALGFAIRNIIVKIVGLVSFALSKCYEFSMRSCIPFATINLITGLSVVLSNIEVTFVVTATTRRQVAQKLRLTLTAGTMTTGKC